MKDKELRKLLSEIGFIHYHEHSGTLSKLRNYHNEIYDLKDSLNKLCLHLGLEIHNGAYIEKAKKVKK